MSSKDICFAESGKTFFFVMAECYSIVCVCVCVYTYHLIFIHQ